ncbi:MAG: cobalamin-binding protein [Treponema sp.]|nr:cobalamin-binding protein [Treponema sp.]
MKKVCVSFLLFYSLSFIFSLERIVSLSPAGTEILYAIGAGNKIVARTDFCDYPAEVKAVPSCGGFDGKALSLETIISYKPDFVFGSKGMHDFMEPALSRLGIELYLSETDSILAIYKEIIYLGNKTSCSEQALRLVAELSEGFEKIRKASENKAPLKVYWETWNAPYMSVGGTSFINEVIEIAGGKNIFSFLTQSYPMVSEESVLAGKPDVIIIQSDSPVTVEDVLGRKVWKRIPAVKNRKVYKVPSDVVSRPGPRLLEACELLASLLE